MQISSYFRSIIQIFKSVCNKFGLSFTKFETFVEIQTNRIGVKSAAEVFSLYIKKNFNQTRGDKELSKFIDFYINNWKLKSSLVNVTGLHTLVLNSSNALSITGLRPAHSGQELTIMNIGSGAVTITRASNLAVRTIYNAKGASLTINQHQAYKFVCNPNQVWYQIS